MWNLLPSERLRCWHDFRKNLDTMSKHEAIEQTGHLWSYTPFVNHYLTTDNLNVWPNPWELLYENIYCDLAKALGIVYTLYLTNHKLDIEIRIYKNYSTAETYNLVWIDKGKYVLNLLHDEVVNKTQVAKDLKLSKVITATDLKLDKLQ